MEIEFLHNVLLVTNSARVVSAMKPKILGAHTVLSSCQQLLRYLSKYPDATYVCIDTSSPDVVEPDLLEKEIHLHGKTVKIIFLVKSRYKLKKLCREQNVDCMLI